MEKTAKGKKTGLPTTVRRSRAKKPKKDPSGTLVFVARSLGETEAGTCKKGEE